MRKLSLLFAAVLLLGLSSGNSLAWLWDADRAENAFTVGSVRLRLEETTGQQYQMVPGCDITKDPTVTVLGGSQSCWLYLQVDEENRPEDFLQYSLTESWLPLPGEEGVWYQAVTGSEEDQIFPVLAENTLCVPDTVLRSQLDLGGNLPKLIFRARAIQQLGPEGIPFTPEEGWATLWQALDASREDGAL